MKLLFFFLFVSYATALKDGWWMDMDQGYPHWYSWLQDIRHSLMNGQIIQIKNAFSNPSRFEPYGNETWEEDVGKIKDMEWYRRYRVQETKQIEEFEYEIQTKHKVWFETLLNLKMENVRPLSNSLTMTKYNESCYLDDHSDAAQVRRLTVIYHISKNHKPVCGGKLYWYGGVGQHKFQPSYNTLYLFIPSEYTEHRISYSHCSERIAISGWFESNQFGSLYHLMQEHTKWKLTYQTGSPFVIEDDTIDVEVDEVHSGIYVDNF